MDAIRNSQFKTLLGLRNTTYEALPCRSHVAEICNEVPLAVDERLVLRAYTNEKPGICVHVSHYE